MNHTPHLLPQHSLGLIGAGALAHNLAAAWAHRQPEGAIDVWARHASAGVALRDAVERSCQDGGDRHQAQPGDPGGEGSEPRETPSSPVRLLNGIDECCSLKTIVLCVRDSDLPGVALELAAHPSEVPGAVVLHASGALSVDVLQPLHAAGYATGRLHPLVSLRRVADGQAFEGVGFAVDGDEFVQARARGLAEWLGGWVLPQLPTETAAVQYHAAASLLAGGVGTLFEHALDGMARALGDRDSARRGLIELLRSVASNLEEVEPRDALTGPAARGDVEVVRSHLHSLTQEGSELYRALLPTMLQLAQARGSLSDEDRARMLAFLAQQGVR